MLMEVLAHPALICKHFLLIILSLILSVQAIVLMATVIDHVKHDALAIVLHEFLHTNCP
jgi:hypothetical protein